MTPSRTAMHFFTAIRIRAKAEQNFNMHLLFLKLYFMAVKYIEPVGVNDCSNLNTYLSRRLSYFFLSVA
jgi:hypothetical protein